METSVTLPWLNLVIEIWIQTRKLWRTQSLNGRVQSSQVTTKSSATHCFIVLRKEDVRPQNLDRYKIAGTLSNQVSWHFAEHQKFYKVKQDILGGEAGTDPAIKHKNWAMCLNPCLHLSSPNKQRTKRTKHSIVHSPLVNDGGGGRHNQNCLNLSPCIWHQEHTRRQYQNPSVLGHGLCLTILPLIHLSAWMWWEELSFCSI